MKCEEVQSLLSPCLDSELDTRTCLEFEQHLKSCPNCASLFAEEQQHEGWMRTGLNRGARTASLWERIERSVLAEAACASRSRPRRQSSSRSGWHAVFAVLGQQFQAGLRRSPMLWGAIAAVWAVILVLDFTAREPDSRLASNQRVPSVSEMRSAWKQKQLLMADLAMALEPIPADKPQPPPPGPRSDLQKRTRST